MLVSGDWCYPVCARDTGMYIAVLFTASLLFAMYGKWGRATSFSSRSVTSVVVLLFLPFAVDGVGSYAGLWESSNLMRYITGACAGISMGTLLAWGVMAPVQKEGEGGARFLSRRMHVATWLIGSVSACILFLAIHPRIAVIGPMVTCASMLFTLTLVNLLLIALATGAGLCERGRDGTVGALAVAVFLGILEIVLMAMMRQMLS